MPPWPEARTIGPICCILGEGVWVCAKVLRSVSGLFGSKCLYEDYWDGGMYRLRANISSTGLEVILCWELSY
jgi:hypothetical protein